MAQAGSLAAFSSALARGITVIGAIRVIGADPVSTAAPATSGVRDLGLARFREDLRWLDTARSVASAAHPLSTVLGVFTADVAEPGTN